ncbi:MAG: hypothetical protein AAF193_08005, partial [Bacteroidota bacterium]
DEPNSHGLVSYKITPFPNIDVGTVLENTALIYFDNNDPIVTNTTWTTIHECGGESNLDYGTATVCSQLMVNFTGTYPWIENYEWNVNGEILSSDSEFLFEPIELQEYEIIYTASNDLCSEWVDAFYVLNEETPIDPCSADFNCDAMRDTQDLLHLLSNYGCQADCLADLDGNEVVNSNDLLLFLILFNRTCWE